MKMIDLRPPPACSESYRRKISLFSKNFIFFTKRTLHHKFSSFKSSNNGKRLYLRILLVVYKQGSPQGGQCTIITSLMIARGRLNYWVFETRFRSSTKNVVRMPCDTEKNAREMPLRNSRPLGTSRCTLLTVACACVHVRRDSVARALDDFVLALHFLNGRIWYFENFGRTLFFFSTHGMWDRCKEISGVCVPNIARSLALITTYTLVILQLHRWRSLLRENNE